MSKKIFFEKEKTEGKTVKFCFIRIAIAPKIIILSCFKHFLTNISMEVQSPSSSWMSFKLNTPHFLKLVELN